MLTISKINPDQARTYFEKSKGERNEYYTKHMTSYDRWDGALAKSIGLSGEMTKEQFDKLADHMKEAHPSRNPAFLDLTFSAAKSVSLMQADPRYHDDMIAAQQAAVAKMTDIIQSDYLQVKVDGKMQGVHNAIFAGFLHELARPTKDKTAEPNLHEHVLTYSTDPDLHIHLLLANMTVVDGKERAIDFSKLLGRNSRSVNKQLGLLYRQYLAKELAERGYPLEVTDEKNGFFEIKGFDREVIEEYSRRRAEVVQTAKERGINDMQKANQLSRTAKDKAKKTPSEIFAEVKKDIFDSKRVVIHKRKEVDDNERSRTVHQDRTSREHEVDGSRSRSRSEIRERSGRGGLQDAASPLFGTPAVMRNFAEKSEPRMSDVQERRLASRERERQHEFDLLLSSASVSRLAECQSESVLRVYLRKAHAQQSRERLKEIDRCVKDVIDDLTATDYAVALPTLKYRIRAACVLMDLSEKDIDRAITRAGLVAIGRKLNKNGKPSKDRYLTTRSILEIEPRITERVGEGKGTIKDAMTNERARAALAKVEDFETQKKHGVAEDGLFKIADGEQGEAVIHALTCKDRFLAIDGLAGTGKTTLMQRMKWVADDEGIEIKGLCFTGKAAAGLQDESGIESTTIHSFLNQLEKQSKRADRAPVLNRALDTPLARDIEAVREARQDGIKQEWDFSHVKPAERREVWIVDEAGLVDMKLMDQLQKAAIARNAQIVFSGDPKQLPPVGVGAPLQDMEKAGMATAYLQEIRRQRKADADVREAVKESVVGDTDKALDLLDKRGDVREIAELDDRRAAIVRTMTEEPFEKYNESLLLVSRNIDRKFYNKSIRSEFVRRGDIAQGEEYKITVKNSRKADTIEKRFFAEHDRIIFKANDKKLGVKNGEMASIVSIDGTIFKARKDNGEEVTFDISRYSTLDHSYAVTNYAAQGMTVRRAVADMDTRSAKQTRNSFYVDISRTKDTAIVFTNDKDQLRTEVRDFAQKARGEDFENVAGIQRRGVQNNDFYKSPEHSAEDRLNRVLREIQEQTHGIDDKLMQKHELPYLVSPEHDHAEVASLLADFEAQAAASLPPQQPEQHVVADFSAFDSPQPTHETAPIRVDDSQELPKMSTPVDEDIFPEPVIYDGSMDYYDTNQQNGKYLLLVQKADRENAELVSAKAQEAYKAHDFERDPKYKAAQEADKALAEKLKAAKERMDEASAAKAKADHNLRASKAEDKKHTGIFSVFSSYESKTDDLAKAAAAAKAKAAAAERDYAALASNTPHAAADYRNDVLAGYRKAANAKYRKDFKPIMNQYTAAMDKNRETFDRAISQGQERQTYTHEH